MKLGIGTVQFGLNYGISNSSGKTPLQEVHKILEIAHRNQIGLLDTASAYGESEKVLGQTLAGRQFTIVTKLSSASRLDPKGSLNSSLEKLRLNSVYGLLLHEGNDLCGPDAPIVYTRLQELKALGWVQKIGVSVYDSEQIEKIFARFKLDLVQVPVSLLDQRLVRSGHLKLLHATGVEIHSRSTFLQGLLLMEPEKLREYFKPIQGLLIDLRTYLSKKGISPVQAALGYLNSIPEVDRVICGVNSHLQLMELVDAADTQVDADEFKAFAITNPAFVNPSQWKV